MANTSTPISRPSRSLLVLAGLFISAGIAHFVIPDYFLAIVPPGLPRPDVLVALSGVAEIAGGVGIVHPATRRLAAAGLISLLVAVFPANIQMLRNWLAGGGGGWYEAALWIRLPLQPLLIWWVYRVGWRRATR